VEGLGILKYLTVDETEEWKKPRLMALNNFTT
jgi:hypothetical protein